MSETAIRPGHCYLGEFQKKDLPVRIERANANGGWTARVLTHGRTISVNCEEQLLYRLTDEEIRGIAHGTIPHRRSAVQGTVFREPTANSENEQVPARRVKRPPIKTLVIVERLNILDAAQRVLSETQTAMTTREILKYAAEKQYWVSDAATPWLTLHAAISRDIQIGGEQSRFVKTERGRFALR